MITQEELKELLDYDPNTGEFYWKVSRSKKIKIGDRASTLNKQGYIVITINYKQYKAHRLAFLWMTGEWPKETIDHISGVKTDNRWSNLRDVSYRDNLCNRKEHRNGRLVGSCFNRHAKKWQAQIYINKHIKHLGYFDTELEAHEVYLTAKAQI